MLHTKTLKGFFLSMSMFASVAAFSADKMEHSLIVDLKSPVNNSMKVVYALSSVPKYWTSGASLYISSNSASSVLPLSSVSQIHFGEDVPTVDLHEAASTSLSLYPNPTVDEVFIHGIGESTELGLTDAKGELLPMSIQRTENVAYLNVSALPAGVYFLNVDGQTLKFIKQ